VRLYPDVPARRAAALLHDALVIVLLVIFGWLGLRVHDTVDKLAIVGTGVKKVGENIPLVGGSIKDAGEEGESSVHHMANLLGLLTFAIPAVLLLWRVLPDRIAAFRRLNSAARVLQTSDEPERQRALAMRAAFSLPYAQLLRYTSDPLGDLTAGRYGPLIDAAVEDAGLRRPR
jgi:hypothetical protein